MTGYSTPLTMFGMVLVILVLIIATAIYTLLHY